MNFEHSIPALRVVLVNEAATEALGNYLSRAAESGLSVALYGELGAGKTTLVRGFIRARGHLGTVKSPTFTVVEPYDLPGGVLYHFDLYRLNDPEELELLGVRDYFLSDAICLVEWPERAHLPPLDLRIELHYHDSGRIATLTAATPRGATVLKMLSCQPFTDSWTQAVT